MFRCLMPVARILFLISCIGLVPGQKDRILTSLCSFHHFESKWPGCTVLLRPDSLVKTGLSISIWYLKRVSV